MTQSPRFQVVELYSGLLSDNQGCLKTKNAGKGFFVTEDVNEDHPLTMYARNMILEWLAEIRKRKVLFN